MPENQFGETRAGKSRRKRGPCYSPGRFKGKKFKLRRTGLRKALNKVPLSTSGKAGKPFGSPWKGGVGRKGRHAQRSAVLAVKWGTGWQDDLSKSSGGALNHTPFTQSHPTWALRTHGFLCANIYCPPTPPLGPHCDSSTPLALYFQLWFSTWKCFFPASIPKRHSLLAQDLERTLILYSSWPAKLRSKWSSHTLPPLTQSYPALPRADPLHKIPWTETSTRWESRVAVANFIPSPCPQARGETPVPKD